MPDVTYPEVGATAGDLPPGYHHVRVEAVVGRGRDLYEHASDLLFAGEVQRRAGADVRMSENPLRTGTRVDMRMRFGPARFAVPCLVVWAERSGDDCGFAYGTLPGHPEIGEERFALRLTRAGDVILAITAFSRPGRWFTRLAPPVGRLVQRRMTHRYLDALRTE